MNPRMRSVTGFVAALAFGASAANAFELISVQEHLAAWTAPETLVPKSAPAAGVPQIDIVQPRVGSTITSPSTIQVAFKASAPGAVRPETFKVLYGRLRLDITQRLLGAASISPEGIQADGASLPKGSHRLLLSIEDSLGRQGQRQWDFEVN